MRKGQGLPVNMIVLVALALLVLVVVGAFFISGFGQASSSINIIEASQADCTALCQGLVTSAYSYDECASYTGTGYASTNFGDFAGTTRAQEYACTCSGKYGDCLVNLRGGGSCLVGQNLYVETSKASWETIIASNGNICAIYSSNT